MSSHVTEYRADFYLTNGDLSFRVDTEPHKDPDSPMVPYLIHGAHIQNSGVEYMRWCRPDLERYIGEMVTVAGTDKTDICSIFTLSARGDILEDAASALVQRIEAFAINKIGGVKQGVVLTIKGMPEHVALPLFSTGNFVLERLSFRADSKVTLFDAVTKHKGKRVRLQQ